MLLHFDGIAADVVTCGARELLDLVVTPQVSVEVLACGGRKAAQQAREHTDTSITAVGRLVNPFIQVRVLFGGQRGIRKRAKRRFGKRAKRRFGKRTKGRLRKGVKGALRIGVIWTLGGRVASVTTCGRRRRSGRGFGSGSYRGAASFRLRRRLGFPGDFLKFKIKKLEERQ
jgi:hypothetical protein